jgi:hypothetical protein
MLHKKALLTHPPEQQKMGSLSKHMQIEVFIVQLIDVEWHV